MYGAVVDELMSPAPPARLSDGVVGLRAISEWDIPEILIAHQDDPGLHVALRMARPPSGAELGREVERSELDRLRGLRIALTIVAPGSDDCIGRVVARVTDVAGGVAALTIWVAPQRRGQGLGRRALALASEWLLGPAGLRRLTLEAGAEDPVLRAAATAAGFAAGASEPRCLELER